MTRYWDEHGFSWHHSHGRDVKNVNPLIEAAIIQLAQGILKRGVKKMQATLLLPEYEHLGQSALLMSRRLFNNTIFGWGHEK
jgi:hypothetical protein